MVVGKGTAIGIKKTRIILWDMIKGAYLLFESENVYVDKVQPTDVQDVVSLYNSNKSLNISA